MGARDFTTFGPMETNGTYVYFALTGDVFDPTEISEALGLQPTAAWKKGDAGKYKPVLDFSGWELASDKTQEPVIDDLITDLLAKLATKTETINELKARLGLHSVLQIVMYVDTNPDQPTPALGYDLKTIEFLHATQTVTDVDIYRFDSKE